MYIPEPYEEVQVVADFYLKHREKMIPFSRVDEKQVQYYKNMFDRDLVLGDYHLRCPLPTKELRVTPFMYCGAKYSKKIEENLSLVEPVKLYGMHPCVGAVLFRPDILEVTWLIFHSKEARERLERCEKVYLTTRAWPIGCDNIYECCRTNSVGVNCHRAETLLYFIE